jgi:hypothetical protein
VRPPWFRRRARQHVLFMDQLVGGRGPSAREA